jgi:hypothetical protein
MTQQTAQSAPAGSASTPSTEQVSPLERLLPLTGAAFALLVAAGYLSIGPFPDETTSTSSLTSYYAAHHRQVGLGGVLIGYAAVLAALFGVALWARMRRGGTPGIVGVAALVGTAVLTVDLARAADVYSTLGRIGGRSSTATDALQAWHIAGAAPTVAAGAVVLLLALAAAGIGTRAVPRALAWSALVLALLLMTPLGFQAWLLFLVWSLATSVVLTLRPAPAVP